MHNLILLAGEEPVVQYQILSAEIVGDGSVKLFNKWSFDDVEVKDISLTYSSSTHDSGLTLLVTTFKSVNKSTFLIQQVDMPRNDSARLNAPLSSVSPTLS